MKPRRYTDQILAQHRRTLQAHSAGQVRQDAAIAALVATVAEQREMILVLESRIADLEATQLTMLEAVHELLSALGVPRDV